MACDWLFVDGSSLIFRAFHGVRAQCSFPMAAQSNAVRDFVDTLARLVSTRRPRHLAVASDEDWRPAWRVELIPSYKAHRTAEPVPPDLEPQMPLIHEVLAAVGIDFVGVADYEAEDVIATWTAKATGTVEIVSGDRDLYALIEDPRVCVLYPEKAGLAVVTEAEETRRYRIPGRRLRRLRDPARRPLGRPARPQGRRRGGRRRHHPPARRRGGLLSEGRLPGTSARIPRPRAARVFASLCATCRSPCRRPGRRDSYPVDPHGLRTLAEANGLTSACDRLVLALAQLERRP